MYGQPNASMTPASFVVTQLTGVYNMDDTALGRMAFKWAGARHSRRCALYDTTHKKGKLSREWESAERQLRVPITFVSRENRPHDIEVVTGGKPPCIVAHTEGRLMLVMLAAEIEACAGDEARLLQAINEAVPKWSLSWP